MITHLREVLQLAESVLVYIGGGAVVTFFIWLYKRNQEHFEDRILVLFSGDEHQEWRTAAGIHADYMVRWRKDVPAWVVFPVGRRDLKWRLRTVPYQVRHLWRMKCLTPSLRKVERTILHLWKKGLLERDIHPKRQYFKLRNAVGPREY